MLERASLYYHTFWIDSFELWETTYTPELEGDVKENHDNSAYLILIVQVPLWTLHRCCQSAHFCSTDCQVQRTKTFRNRNKANLDCIRSPCVNVVHDLQSHPKHLLTSEQANWKDGGIWHRHQTTKHTVQRLDKNRLCKSSFTSYKDHVTVPACIHK